MPSNKIGNLDRGQGLRRQAAQATGEDPLPVEQGFAMNADTEAAGFGNAGGKGPALPTHKGKGGGG